LGAIVDEPPTDIVDRYRTVVAEVEADECDQCPHDAHVQAYLYAELSTGTIALCGHHGRAAIPRLTELGAHIIDLTHLIG
jgi:hypothetical protein